MIYIALGIVILGIAFVITGLVLSKGIEVNYHEIEEDFELNIAQITDTHFDNKYNKEDYETLFEDINNANPDVLLFTGDLFQVGVVSTSLEEDIIDFLKEFEADTKLAVLGNHDYYHGEDFTNQVIRILESAGFTVLFNELVEITVKNQVYNFVGLDDLMQGDSYYTTVLKSIDAAIPTFIVAHEPDTFGNILQYDFITMFCGHSHGGQVRLPFIGDIVNVPGAKNYNEHHYNEEGKDLYVSFGLGESMIRIRFFNKRQAEIYTYS